MSVLMCRPEYFGIEYEINPWMKVSNKVDNALARAQWQALYDNYVAMGVTVELMDPVRGLPDMVFTANAGVVWNNTVVLTRFHHAERQGEEPFFQAFFEKHGMTVHLLDPGVSMEGAGDFLFVGDRLFAGWGFRTDRAVHSAVADLLGVEVVSLELRDARFYHLDTCFSPLDNETVLFNPLAFAPESAALIRELVPRSIDASVEAAEGFGCNATTLGTTVISSSAIEHMAGPLSELGFDVRGLPMTEFMKSGGGVRCLTLPLELGRVGANSAG